jgi:hypothetical protein
MLTFQPPVNFCSDKNIQTIFGTKLEDFLNYRIDYNLISQTVEKVVKKYFLGRMDVTIYNTGGEVSAKCVKTHVAHQMDLGKIPLPKLERNELATKISQKIPFDDIINEIRDTVTEEKMERMHLLTRKDLFNIEKLYNLNNYVRHSSDYVSVEAWISEIQENVCDSVIRFYKGQGQLDSPYCELRTEDFLLIIMNDAQLETLKKNGSDCICIDSTHGLNAYNFELTTLMVLDELRQGFPCLFVFSNRSDNVVFKIVFTVLRQALGVSATSRVFMSDMAENFYIAWSDVMGPVEFRLFCSWHVLRAWKKNVNSKIKKTEKQLSVHATLRILLEKLDETAFEKMLENFISQITTNDHELTDFGQYFLKNYYYNRKSWAYCYRKHTGLNTNMHLERMHRTLKYIYLKKKTVKRLDKAINAIMKLVRDTLYEKLIIIHKGIKRS